MLTHLVLAGCCYGYIFKLLALHFASTEFQSLLKGFRKLTLSVVACKWEDIE